MLSMYFHGKGVTLAQYFKTTLTGGRGCKSTQFPALLQVQQRRIPTPDFLMAWETLPSWESRPTPTCSSSSRCWGVGIGGDAPVLRVQRRRSGCQGSKSSYSLFSLLKQCEWRSEADVFQGSHMVSTDEAVWDVFCSLSVRTMQSVMFVVIFSWKLCMKEVRTLCHILQ